MSNTLLFSGSSNPQLADRVAKELNISLGNVDLTRFADGEARPWIQEDVRDKTVFILQSLSKPIDEYVMELVLMGDAIRRGAPRSMVAIVPYMGYARQDKQNRMGEPVSARVIAKFLEVSQFSELITVDLHNDAIVGFFQVPVTHLSALPLLADEIRSRNIPDGLIISPDVGGVRRARNLAYELDLPLVVMEKKRYLDKHDHSESFQIIGEVKGKHAVVIDDMISTGGTIVECAKSLVEAGATGVTVLVTHGVLSGQASQNLADAPIDEVVITDTIAIPKERQFDTLSQASVAPLIADAIRNIVQ